MQLLKKESDIFTNDLADWQLWSSYKWGEKLNLELFNIELTLNPFID